MAEPGRFFSSDAFYLVCRVIGSSTNRKYSAESDKPKSGLFVNDGLYQNFLNVLIEKITPVPIPLTSRGSFIVEGQDQAYTIWGQTCCGIDKISCCTRLPGVVQRGDWLCYSSMGGKSLLQFEHIII
jgi:ornithine decarboxylase